MANNNKHTGPNVPALRFPKFSGEWENKCLGDISENISSGKTKSTTKEGKYVLIGSTGVIGNTSDADYSGNLILVARVGANAGLINYYSGDCGITDNTLIIKPLEQEKNFCHYVYHYLKHCNLNQYVFGSGQPLITGGMLKRLPIRYGTIDETNKLSSLFDMLDARIEAQSKIIKELTTLRSALLEKVFQVSNPTLEVGAIAHQTSERNKLCRYSNVLSVSNRFGFINQSEQFEDRNVASDDVRNYKVVHRGDFAYNPARINVGSIAMLKSFESGIVSPMYICFQVDDTIVDPSFFELFLETKAFKDEMEIRLEGSVRRCLSFEALCEIHMPRPALLVQRSITDKIGNISSKIKLEDRILRAYIRQKEWLLKQMFI